MAFETLNLIKIRDALNEARASATTEAKIDKALEAIEAIAAYLEQQQQTKSLTMSSFGSAIR